VVSRSKCAENYVKSVRSNQSQAMCRLRPVVVDVGGVRVGWCGWVVSGAKCTRVGDRRDACQAAERRQTVGRQAVFRAAIKFLCIIHNYHYIRHRTSIINYCTSASGYSLPSPLHRLDDRMYIYGDSDATTRLSRSAMYSRTRMIEATRYISHAFSYRSDGHVVLLLPVLDRSHGQ
jgi:hypothetical protein